MQPDIIYHRLSAYSSLCLKDRDFRKPTVDEECSHSDGPSTIEGQNYQAPKPV